MIGLVCLDQVLRERGWTVANLGADVPAEDLARFLTRNEARLVAITASHPSRTEAATVTAATVRGAAPGLTIMLGGRLAADPGVAAVVGVDWSGHSIAEATRFADGVLDRLSTDET